MLWMPLEDAVEHSGPAKLANRHALSTRREGASAALWGPYEPVPLRPSDVWNPTKTLGPSSRPRYSMKHCRQTLPIQA